MPTTTDPTQKEKYDEIKEEVLNLQAIRGLTTEDQEELADGACLHDFINAIISMTKPTEPTNKKRRTGEAEQQSDGDEEQEEETILSSSLAEATPTPGAQGFNIVHMEKAEDLTWDKPAWWKETVGKRLGMVCLSTSSRRYAQQTWARAANWMVLRP